MSATPQTKAHVSDFMERHFKHLRDGRKEYTEAEVRSIMLAFDAELRRLDAENERLKKSLALVQQHHVTAWSRGHEAGLRASADAVKQATDAVNSDAWGNSQLTDALLAAESERDQLRAQLALAVAAEREAGDAVDEPQSTPIACAVHVAGRTFEKGVPFCDVIDYIESNTTRWVASSDRRPPEGERVFFMDLATNIVGFDMWAGEGFIWMPSHWMPIPPAPTMRKGQL